MEPTAAVRTHTPAPAGGIENRRHPRYPIDLRARFIRQPTGLEDAWIYGRATNISQEGLFLETESVPPPMGTRLICEIQREMVTVLRAECIVRWVRPPSESGGVVGGIGVQILALDTQTQDRVQKAIDSYLRPEVAPPPPSRDYRGDWSEWLGFFYEKRVLLIGLAVATVVALATGSLLYVAWAALGPAPLQNAPAAQPAPAPLPKH